MPGVTTEQWMAAISAKSDNYSRGMGQEARVRAWLAEASWVLATLHDIAALPECPEQEET